MAECTVPTIHFLCGSDLRHVQITLAGAFRSWWGGKWRPVEITGSSCHSVSFCSAQSGNGQLSEHNGTACGGQVWKNWPRHEKRWACEVRQTLPDPRGGGRSNGVVLHVGMLWSPWKSKVIHISRNPSAATWDWKSSWRYWVASESRQVLLLTWYHFPATRICFCMPVITSAVRDFGRISWRRSSI